METRTMTLAEYNALPDCPAKADLPEDALVIGIFRDGRIVGRAILVSMLHLEGTWVAEEERNGMVGARLEREAAIEAAAIGAKTLLAYTATPKHGEYMKRLGYQQMPVRVWSKEIPCR